MFRDKFKDERYFRDSLPSITDHIKRAKNKILKLETELNDKVPLVNYYNVANGILIYIKRAYSLGAPVSELITPAREMLANYARSWHLDADYTDGGDIAYSELLSMISIGLLTNAKNELLSLSKIIERVGYRDHLVSFMLFMEDQNIQITPELLWTNDIACKELKKIALAESLAAEQLVSKYLNTYFYTKENFEDEYNSHRRDDNVYDGYWSFEAGALVKIKNLHDDHFKDSPYYPFDMVHYIGSSDAITGSTSLFGASPNTGDRKS